jgi:hypothetical protein
MKWAKDLTAGEGFIIFILTLAVFAAAKTVFPLFPFDMTAVTLAGGFSAMTAQRYFKNKAEIAVRAANGKEPVE